MNKKVPLFNPLLDKFSRVWFDDDNVNHELSMDPIAITYFTEPQARFMLKHLTDKVMATRELNDINHAKERLEIISQIKVQI